MAKKTRLTRLRISKRDREILDHVARYRLTTSEILHKLLFETQQHNAVTKVTVRLCRAQLLSKFILDYPRTYFTLGAQAAQHLGLPAKRSEPLGPQSLPSEYAVLAYATLGSAQHQRMTAEELRGECPWVLPHFEEAPYCLDRTQRPPVLELLRVDLGGTADHVARKCLADVQVRRQQRQFDELVLASRFRLVVATSTTEKAAGIRTALDNHVWPDGLQLHLAVVPDLLQLTARL